MATEKESTVTIGSKAHWTRAHWSGASLWAEDRGGLVSSLDAELAGSSQQDPQPHARHRSIVLRRQELVTAGSLLSSNGRQSHKEPRLLLHPRVLVTRKLKKDGAAPDSERQGAVRYGGRSVSWEFGAAGHTASAFRKQREMAAGAQFIFSFLFSPGPSAYLRWVFQPDVDNPSQTCPEISYGDSKSHQVDGEG